MAQYNLGVKKTNGRIYFYELLSAYLPREGLVEALEVLIPVFGAMGVSALYYLIKRKVLAKREERQAVEGK